MKSVTPFLMFQNGKGNEALEYYMEIFPNSNVEAISYYSEEDEGGEAGTIQQANFTINGQSFKCIDSNIEHKFDFTPSFSIFIECESEAEVEKLYHALLEGGQVLMPIGNYGFSQSFGWINDRFGVSWQLNYK